MIKKIIIPKKLADAYNSLINTRGISLTKTSLTIPPPMAVKIPAKDIARKFNPNISYAILEPIIVKTPKPIASNFKNKFSRSLKKGCKKNTMIPETTAIVR